MDTADILFKAFIETAPDKYDCKCRQHKTYNKDDTECKECYAASRLSDVALSVAARKGDYAAIVDILTALFQPSKYSSSKEEDKIKVISEV